MMNDDDLTTAETSPLLILLTASNHGTGTILPIDLLKPLSFETGYPNLTRLSNVVPQRRSFCRSLSPKQTFCEASPRNSAA